MNIIVFRILLTMVLVANLIILMLCALTGVNIYKVYGLRILKIGAICLLMITCFYVSLALIGLTN